MLNVLMLAANGRRAEALTLLDRVGEDATGMAWGKLAAAMSSSLRGDRKKLLEIMTPELRAAVHWDDIFCWWSADCFALVDERASALDCLERAVDFGYVNYPFLAEHEPFLENIRSEARFERLMERVRAAWNAFEP